MGIFFSSIYALFRELYGTALATYLAGQTSATGNNQFITYGIFIIVISLLFAAVFYYFLSSPRLAKVWVWTIHLIFSAVVGFFYGWLQTLSDLQKGLMAVIDPETGEKVTHVVGNNCLWFGITNAVLAAIFFFLWSMVIKKWSPMACRTPF